MNAAGSANSPANSPVLDGVAIIGMAGRFPGASSVAEFWQNQLAGIEAISRFTVEELEVPNAAELAAKPNYVLARAILKDIDLFDADFFGMLPREAELTDPQQRLFLESCWEAFENSGYDPARYPGAIGVFAGTSYPSYFLSRVCARPGFVQSFTGEYQIGNYPAMVGNNPDFLATRVAYKFNLRGPAFTLQAGCSTSLLAVCQACQSLLTYQSDMALAGGVSITLPQKRGYFYQDGGMGSADGHCRTFDADAQGTVFGSGVGVVMLKRVEDALRDGDQIHAVIRGFGVNNDGAAKVGYTAPSIEGQANVISMAQQMAGVDPATIGYIEAHGTATPLGDPIELAALTRAFRASTDAAQFCTIGTAKTNVGHLDIAAGVTGLIHATHVVREGKLPPTLHFEKPTPNFDLASSPFRVNTKLADWETNGLPRRAGVSAFGVGGTNAHLILEEALTEPSEASPRREQLLVVSARSQTALDASTRNLANWLEANPSADLANVAFTLQAGRRAFDHRRFVVANEPAQAAALLGVREHKRVFTRAERPAKPEVAFLFPGQGAQRPGMGGELYQTERVFREEIDRVTRLFEPHLSLDLRTLLYPAEVTDAAHEQLRQTALAQPAIFAVEYALAKLWMSWGIEPAAMIGHSIGEFVAATLAGVFSLNDAVRLVAARGRLMQSMPAGAMLSVRAPLADVSPLIHGELSLAAENAPSLLVASGPFEAIAKLETTLAERGVPNQRLHTSHAFHSAMMDPILEAFAAELRATQLHAPRLSWISTLTGNWITADEATDPAYWGKQLRSTVKFSPAVARLRENGNAALLEVGPGTVLATLARQNPAKSANQLIVSSLADGNPDTTESVALQQALGALWLAGIEPDWAAYHADARRSRVALPTYPFERKRFWLDVPEVGQNVLTTNATSAVQPVSPVSPALPDAPTDLEQDANTMNVQDSKSRQDVLKTKLAEIFLDLSGIEITGADTNATFLDLGFDSLFLTQVTQALQQTFSLKITFRQLLGDQSTLESLAAYIDEKLPAGAFEEAAPAPAPVPVASAPIAAPSSLVPPTFAAPAAAAQPLSGSVEQLMRDQLAAMNSLFSQQLAALKGSPIAAPAPAAPQPIATPAPVAATVPQPAPVAAAPSAKPAAAAKEADSKELKGYTPFKPLQKSISGDLTPQQENYIRGLVERYTTRTAGSKAKTQEYRPVLADPRVVTGFRQQWKEMIYPIITTKSKGSHLWDVDGNQYVDILNGFGPIMLGHRPDFVEKAIEKQLHEGFEIGPQTLLAGEVARTICEMTGNERATFCNTGSEAVLAAMRVARTVTGRNRVVFFAGDYHGMFDEVLIKGFKKGGEPHSNPIAPGIPRQAAENITVLDYGTPESLEWIRKNADTLAAVLVEPVQSRHPNLQPVSFLKELRAITEQSGTCFVFDEVVTGFRVHPGGCQALFGIRADLATYGKVLAGGMPIGVLAGKKKYMDALDGGMWQYGDDSYPEVGVTFFAGTFVRHPLTMAACQAMLAHLKHEGPGLQQRLSERTAGLVARLNSLLEANGVPAHIENFASIFYFAFDADARFGSLFYYSLRAKGIHLLENFPCFLTTEHSDADLAWIERSFAETIAEMQAGGTLPPPPGGQHADEAADLAVAAEAPLTEAQREIWLSAQLSPEASSAYNESFTLRLTGDLDRTHFLQALQELVNRHDALRARFSAEGETMRFAAHEKLDVAFIDISSLAAADREARLSADIAEQARKPFDLEHGPLVRVQLFRLEPEVHALVFTSHHIVCDGWSVNVLLDELSRLYTSGASADLPTAVSFSAYAREQAKGLDSAEMAKVESYWLKQFETPATVLDLPTDRPRAAVKSFAGHTFRTRIDADSYKRIKAAGAKQGCTLFVTLLAGFSALLHRLSSQDDIVVGVPTAAQSLLDDGSLVGHCVNFLPIRTQLTETETASELLAATRRTLLDAYEHQTYTYGTLVRKLKLRRDPSRLPLVEVQFNLEKVGSGIEFRGLSAQIDPNPKAAVNFDIFLNVGESADGLLIDCDYNTDLFDYETIERWLGHYRTLLEGIAANPASLIDALPLLTDGERTELVTGWNRTAMDYPRDRAVQQLIEEQAARTPKAIAVSCADERLTYAELDARANQLAHHLISVGVRAGDLVGVATDRSLEMLVGLLGIWKAGAAYVPLDPAYPKDRLAYIVDQTAIPVLLTQEKFVSTIPANDARVICLDRDWPAISRESSARPQVAADPARNAYVIFTSGSTGKPKGVEVTQQNVVNLLVAMQQAPGIAAADRLLAVTTLSFDIAGLELFLPLITGAEVVLATREMTIDGRLLIKAIAEKSITIMQATPATWRLMLEAGWKGSPSLKILCGGEALPRDLANQLVAAGASVWNMYGPTETTIWSSTSQVEKGSEPVTIGPPIGNTQFYVLDRLAHPLPIGVPGELYIGGDGVARGYYKRSDLTADRFVADRFRFEPGARLYRTGDLVRYRADGRIEFLGRLDNQVKVRGFRIELGEIESVLAQYPGVREVVTIARQDTPGDVRLVAYLVTENNEQPAVSALRSWIGRSLPEYMVPSFFVFLEEFPRTPNGKVDRKQLPAPDAGTQSASAPYVAPRTPTETALATIAAEVLHLDQVSCQTSLFDLGADSIHLFQIIARAGRAGLTITPQQILRLRSVSAIAAEIEHKQDQPAASETTSFSEIKPVSRDRYRVRLTTTKA